MAANTSDWLVETDWLEARLEAPDIVILDATWHLTDSNLNAHEEYRAEHIPGALFFDIDEIADTGSPLPHMLPSPEKFSSRMRAKGIGDGMRVIVYDSYGLFSAARVWWNFRVMGHNDVSVLNGGLRKWKTENRPLETHPPTKRSERHFTSRRDAGLVSDVEDILSAMKNTDRQIVDARSAERFAGTAAEPREGLRAGHIPGSHNLYYGDLLNEDGTMKQKKAILELADNAGIDLNKPIITSCGSGITACIVALAFGLAGDRLTSVYDGSWSEWGADENLPIEN